MPTFLRRIKPSIQHHSYQTSHKSTAVDSTVREGGHDDQSPDHHDHDGEDHRDGRSIIPPLPEIKDSGPLTGNRYSGADIFWNSTMTEVDDSEKEWLAKKTRRNYSDTESTEFPILGRAKSSKRKRPVNFPNHLQEENVTNAASGSTAARQGTNDGFRRLERRISYGKERANNDLVVMFYAEPDYAELPAVHQQQQRSLSTLTAGTRELDDSMDAPLQSLTQVHRAESEQTSDIFQESTSVLRPSSVLQEERNLQDIPIVHHFSNSPHPSSQSSKVLTWNLCLSEILNNGAVDPAMKEAVKDRVKSSNTTNGNSEYKHFVVSAAEAGLVPNFSYPVAGSPYFDRLAAEESLPPSPIDGATEGDHIEHERHIPNLTNRSLDLDFGFGLPNGVPSCPSSLSTYSSSTTNDSLYRAPSPINTDLLNKRINSLLSEVLTTSELNLCHTILNTPIHSNAIHPDTQIRLTHALHTLIYHLQDRILHLEDALLPHLGSALERKTFIIDVLSTQIKNLGDQIRELQLAIDFGNRILTGCWVREYEVWRTLVGIREKRGRGWCRWIKKKEVRELTEREIDALVLMAKQNVEILREDVEDMIEMVERCKNNHGGFPVVGPVEGTWRDV